MNAVPTTMAQPTHMTVPQVIDAFWLSRLQILDAGASDHIEMPITLKDVIGNDGVAIVAARFMAKIEAPVMTVEDEDHGLIHITPSRFLLGHDSIVPGAKKPKAKALKEEKVARPPNAFILYRQHHHPLVKASHPELHNNQISVILGTQWKNEKESTKARYIGLAQKLKVKHFLEHPDYQYQPRKPSEKKRRMTRRKAAALAESAQSMSSSSTNTTSALDESPSSVEQSTSTIPDLHKTLGGNAVLELGDETMDDEAFAAMLEKYNQSIPAANNPTAVAIGNPVIFYDEPSEAAQNDANFYSSILDYNPFAGDEDEEMQGVMTGQEGLQAMRDALSPNNLQATWDEQNEAFFNAELKRNAQLGKWCTLFDE